MQEPSEDAPAGTAVSLPVGVPGVVKESGVSAGGVSVGKDKPGLVGGRVEVMKIDLVGAGVSSETVMHDAKLRLRMENNIHIFCIRGFYFGKIKASTLYWALRHQDTEKNLITPCLSVSEVILGTSRVVQTPARKIHNYRRTHSRRQSQ